MSIKFVSQQQPRGTSLEKPCKIYIHIKAKNMQVSHTALSLSFYHSVESKGSHQVTDI